ncbi:hypothetical protein NDU88_000752 [Pleurodeles waltl]|uniref:Uncharacterized protein n=1 Tax=Pleurodeles waltl TaxID=8319 RepID=A0AAV7V8E6_PLEWA|nr:hypothetical protein NDU88_000752 [Pleurodeles waltl]
MKYNGYSLGPPWLCHGISREPVSWSISLPTPAPQRKLGTSTLEYTLGTPRLCNGKLGTCTLEYTLGPPRLRNNKPGISTLEYTLAPILLC